MESVAPTSRRARRKERHKQQQHDHSDSSDRNIVNPNEGTDVANRTKPTVSGVVNQVSQDTQVLIDELDDQKVIGKHEKVKMKTQTGRYKEKVTTLFDSLRDVLKMKENELLDNIDVEFDKNLKTVDGFLTDISGEKARLEYLGGYGCIDDEEEVQSYVKRCVSRRAEALEELSAPELRLNERIEETVQHLNFGEVLGMNTTSTDDGYLEQPENSQDLTNASDLCDNENAETGVPNETIEPNETLPNETSEHGETGEPDEAAADPDNDYYYGYDEYEDYYADETESASGYSEVEAVTPTAPALSETAEDPPPYWQACGLNQPQELPQQLPTVDIPSYHEIPHSTQLPENILEPWHSFPIQRELDRRSPFVVALTWNYGRICLSDRANMKVKFFVPRGHLLKAMQFLGHELYDITFLEQIQGDTRYLLSCPKNFLLFIISIDHTNTAQIVRKVDTKCAYSCVCRGPREQTLVGVQLANKQNPLILTAVHIFTFSGEILMQITLSPSSVPLNYPKAIEVFESNIIVLDWKLNSVCIYLADGQGIAEYRGTPEHPLVDPLDLTLDHRGNIMILNGQFNNIHVIDQSCHQLEVIKIPRNFPDVSTAKLIAFDTESCKLSLVLSKGKLAVYTFEGGYETLNQRHLPPRSLFNQSQSPVYREPEVLPLVEGMLPSTIEGIVSRQPSRNRNRQFHL